MNNSAYVFGNLGGGYTQYPEDYAHEIYEEFQLKAEAPSQVIIHRDKGIMYYGYVRKLDRDGQYIGLCVLLNGVMLSRMANLFSVFEKVVSEMVSQGELIKMDDNGDIIGVADRLDEKQQEVERIVTYLREEIVHWESTATRLPPVNYSISNDSSRTFSLSDKDEDIVEASVKYGYICVQKHEEYDTPLLVGLRNVLKRKAGLNTSAKAIGSQQGENNALKVIIWITVIVALAVVAFFVPKNCMNSSSVTPVVDSVAIDSVATDASLDNKDLIIKGDISNIGFSMKLYVSNGVVNGTEHYDSQPSSKFVRISGNVDDDGSMHLYEYDTKKGEETGHFSGVLSDGLYSGTWSSASGKSLSFTAHIVNQDKNFDNDTNPFLYILLNTLLDINLETLDTVDAILNSMGFDYVCESVNGGYWKKDCDVIKSPAYSEQYNVETDRMETAQIGYSCTPKNATEESVLVETDAYRGPVYVSVTIWGKENFANWQKQLKANGYVERFEKKNNKWTYTKKGKYEITLLEKIEYGKSAYSLLIWGE